MTDSVSIDRSALIRRGLWINWFTIGYNTVEAVVSVAAGVVSGSVALVSFGVDSGIEVTSSLAAHWRLRADIDPERRERVERVTHSIIGSSFLALAAYVIVESVTTLSRREAPEASPVGVVILVLSAVIMPLIARASGQVARALGSRALEADAAQTSLCAYLSVIALAGVGLNAALGWWWADPVAALVMVPIIAREGVEGIRGTKECGCWLLSRFPGCLGLVPWLCCDMNSGKRAKVGAIGRLTRPLMLVLGIVSVPSVGLGAMQRSHCTRHEPSAGAHSGHEQMPDPRTSWEASTGHECPHCPATECAQVAPCANSSNAALLAASPPVTSRAPHRVVLRRAQRQLHSATHQPPTPPPQVIA